MSKNLKKLNLEPRLAFINRRLELQTQKLTQALERFTQRDKAIFARIVDAQTKHDQARSNVFSNELVEVRKMNRLIGTAKLNIEAAKSRLSKYSTIYPEEDFLTVALLTRKAQEPLRSIFPEAESELGEIFNCISGLTIEVAIENNATIETEAISRNIQKILQDNEAAADKNMKDLYPSIPEAKPEQERPEFYSEIEHKK